MSLICALSPSCSASHEGLGKILSDPLVQRHLCPLDRKVLTVEEWFRAVPDCADQSDVIYDAKGAPIGAIRTYSHELCYFVARASWGQGIGKQAVRLFLEKLRSVGLEQVTAKCSRNNLPSRALLERNGFRFSRVFSSCAPVILEYQLNL